jgi:hypothetical protein
MQTLTGSPQLNQYIRAMKKSNTSKNVSTSNERTLIHSFKLSQEEEQAVKSINIQQAVTKVMDFWS